ncbi:MAG: hypothetical protein OXU23_11495 [Candidatus Poribacteria bacterium]|nr:hypothetical protein [Candidatus Poribacteria bacterium]
MEGIKIGYVHQSLWHGILVCLVVVCPFLASAEPDDTQSETQETPQVQNPPPQVTRQDIRDMNNRLIEQQEMLMNYFTRSIVMFGILLFVILLFFAWLFFQYRSIVSELDDIKRWVGTFSNANSNLKRDLSDISNRIQKLAKTSDMEKLASENQNSTQEILNFLKPIVDKTTDEASSPSQKKLESSEQIEEDTRDLELTPAIADLCDRYNAGIQDKNKRNDFLQRYHNPYKIHVENATDRRVKQQIKPIFKTHSASGDFLGCYVEEEKSYAVVPAYQLRIVHAILHYGAFVDVFECHEHEFDDPDGCYEVVRIIKPAIFEPDDAKETWMFQSKGILELKEV